MSCDPETAPSIPEDVVKSTKLKSSVATIVVRSTSSRRGEDFEDGRTSPTKDVVQQLFGNQSSTGAPHVPALSSGENEASVGAGVEGMHVATDDATPPPEPEPSGLRSLFPGLSVFTDLPAQGLDDDTAFGRGGPITSPTAASLSVFSPTGFTFRIQSSNTMDGTPGYGGKTAETQPVHEAALPRPALATGRGSSPPRPRLSTPVISIDEYRDPTPRPSPGVRPTARGTVPSLNLSDSRGPAPSFGSMSEVAYKPLQSLRFQGVRKDSSVSGSAGFPGYSAGVIHAQSTRRQRAQTADAALDGMLVFRGQSARELDPMPELPMPIQSLCGRFCCCTAHSRRTCKRVLLSKAFGVALTLAVVFTLFGDDARLAAVPPAFDDVFSALTTTCLALFLFETSLCISVVPNYVTTMYFWLDVACMLSLLPDIGWFWLGVSGQSDARFEGFYADRNGNQFRAARAARLVAKASRVLRIVRMMRLFRLVKVANWCVKALRRRQAASAARNNDASKHKRSSVVPSPPKAQRNRRASKVGEDGDNTTTSHTDEKLGGRSRRQSSASGVKNRRNTDETDVDIMPHLAPLGVPPQVPKSPRPSDPIQWPDSPRENGHSGVHSPRAALFNETVTKLDSKMYMSRLAKALADLSTRRIVLLVLFVAILTPFLDPAAGSLSRSGVSDRLPTLAALHRYAQDKNISSSAFEFAVEEFSAQLSDGASLLYLSVCGSESACTSSWSPEQLRSMVVDDSDWLPGGLSEIKRHYRFAEFQHLRVEGCYDASGNPVAGTCVSQAVFSVLPQMQHAARFSILNTVFLVLLILISAILYTHDSDNLVVYPIERMTAMMVELAKNPLKSLQSIRKTIAHKYGFIEDVASFRQPGKKSSDESAMKLQRSSSDENVHRGREESYETVLLENVMMKIGGLLQVGFGEAGGAIIAKNIRKKGHLDCLIPGVKVDAIFGFCDIRQFTDVTECLQEEVMVFVNQISNIVHGATARLGGFPNKNIGDAFLLVWKLPRVEPYGRGATSPTGYRSRATSGATGSVAGPQRLPPHPPPRQPPGVRPRRSRVIQDITEWKRTMNRSASSSDHASESRAGGEAVTTPGMLFTDTSTRAQSNGSLPSFPSGMDLTQTGPSVLSPVHEHSRANVVRKKSNPSMSSGHPAIDRIKRPSLEASGVSTLPERKQTPRLAPLHQRAGRLSLPALQLDYKALQSAALSVPPSSSLSASRGRVLSECEPTRQQLSVQNEDAVIAIVQPLSTDSQPVPRDATESKSNNPSPKLVPHTPTRALHTDGSAESAEGDVEDSIALAPARKLMPSGASNRKQRSFRWSHQPESALSPRGRDGSPSARTRSIQHTESVESRANNTMQSTPPLMAPATTPMTASTGSRPSFVRQSSEPRPGSNQRMRRPSLVLGGDMSESGLARGRNRAITAKLADNALAAFIKCIVDVYNANIDGVLQPFTTHPEIMSRFVEGWLVQIGFGLHIGWAIEGAIGSSHKIDATYLSPHVNLAARLEEATKLYRVPILMSSQFAIELSPAAQTYLRLLDRVTMVGCAEPMELYGFDVDWGNIPSSFGEDPFNVGPGGDGDTQHKIVVDFATDPNVAALQASFSDEFFDTFDSGVRAYLDGNWNAARRHLRRVQETHPDDGPTLCLLEYIQEYDAPHDWPGYRALTEK